MRSFIDLCEALTRASEPVLLSEDVTPRLVPAMRLDGKVHRGGVGQNHADVAQQVFGGQPGMVAEDDMGFVDHRGRFLDRTRAQAYAVVHDLLADTSTRSLTTLSSEQLKTHRSNLGESVVEPQVVSEAAPMLDKATYEIKGNESGNPVYEFHVPLSGGATLGVRVTIDDVYANIDIETDPTTDDDGRLHPEAFNTTRHPDANGHEMGVRIGTVEMRSLLRYVMQTVREQHPEVEKLAGWRATGARGLRAAPNPNMTLKM